MTQERGFEEFKESEIDVGMDYAEDVLKVRLVRSTLIKAGNHAGAIRKEQRCLPRRAATYALHEYCRRNRITIGFTEFNGYVRAIAKMMNGRNPTVKAKRLRDEAAADLRAASS